MFSYSGWNLENSELGFRCKKSGYFTKSMKKITKRISIDHQPVNNDTKTIIIAQKRQ